MTTTETTKIYLRSGLTYCSYHVAELVKVSPSGQTTVKFNDRTMRFTPEGKEIGGSEYSGYRLISKEQYDSALAQRAKESASLKINEQVNALGQHFWNRGRSFKKDELLAALAALTAAVEAF